MLLLLQVCEWCRRAHPNLCPAVVFTGAPPVDGALTPRMVVPHEQCFTVRRNQYIYDAHAQAEAVKLSGAEQRGERQAGTAGTFHYTAWAQLLSPGARRFRHK